VIEKMKFLSITGPKADIDRVVSTYLNKYEIHLENALAELTTVENLSPYLEINPYKEAQTTANEYYQELEDTEQVSPRNLNLTDAIAAVRKIDEKHTQAEETRAQLEEQIETLTESLRVIRPFRNLDYNMSSILKFRFIRYRFGRIEKQYYEKFKAYIYDNLDTVFIKCDDDNEYIWGLYFVPSHEAHKIDAVYSSMHFERIFIPDQYEGTAREACQNLEEQLSQAVERLENQKKSWQQYLNDNAAVIAGACATLDGFSRRFDVRKLAACTRSDRDNFYILCGWMSE